MALLSTSHASSLLSCKTPSCSLSESKTPSKLAFPTKALKPFLFKVLSRKNPTTTPPFRSQCSLADSTPDSDSEPGPNQLNVTDEWAEKVEPDPVPEYPRALDSDPPRNDDEWEEEYVGVGNGHAAAAAEGEGAMVEKDARVQDLKRCLVDTVYGTDFGFRVSPEVRAEVLELVNQLEALNPIPAPVDATEVLDGNWVLVYTAFSELLALLAVGATPLLKVKSISQAIDTGNLSILNSTTLSSPFATFSFSASATFEVRSPSRIQVEFKESTLQPPEIKPSIDLPENVDVFGQKINLLPIRQSLNPLQEAVANISRIISGQPPLKIPIPGNRTSSWLLVTYLDDDFRISRGDGGLFVLAREGSPLLDQ